MAQSTLHPNTLTYTYNIITFEGGSSAIGDNTTKNVGLISNGGKRPLFVSLLPIQGADNYLFSFADGIVINTDSVNCGRINAKKMINTSMYCNVAVMVLWLG